jgi:hypothetical protein
MIARLMAPQETIDRLCSFERRAAGSDAERLAARWLAQRLRDGGRDAEVETHWVRPHWPLAGAAHAVAGVAGTLLTTTSPVAGLAVVGVAFLSMLLDLTGRPSLGRMATYRRATQNVVAAPPAPGEDRGADSDHIRLVVVAAYDARRRGLVYRPALRRLDARIRRALSGRWPSGPGWMAIALAGLSASAAARMAGVDATWLATVQLILAASLLVAVALLLDVALSEPSPDAGGASAVATAIALVEALDAQPPRGLDVELVLAGAGDGPSQGAGGYVARRRRRWDPARLAVLELRPCAAGQPRFWVRDGALFSLPLHPRLIELARGAARDEAHLGAREHAGRADSAAYRARQARWPAIAVGALDRDDLAPRARQASDTPDTVDPAAMRATLELCLALVRALDDDLAARERA